MPLSVKQVGDGEKFEPTEQVASLLWDCICGGALAKLEARLGLTIGVASSEIPEGDPESTWHNLVLFVERFQRLMRKRPECPLLRLGLALQYYALDYKDLAVGEAYNALLLKDEVSDDDKVIGPFLDTLTVVGCVIYKQMALHLINGAVSKVAYTIIVYSLMELGCDRSAADFLRRAIDAHPEFDKSGLMLSSLADRVEDNRGRLPPEERTVEKTRSYLSNLAPYLADRALVRREIYPWNHSEPQRCGDDSVKDLNSWLQEVGPKLVVKTTKLPALAKCPKDSGEGPKRGDEVQLEKDLETVEQLGLFAKEDLYAGEVILDEPSLLTAVARLNDEYCDACAGSLPSMDPSFGEGPIACEGCGTTIFCSIACHDAAQSDYHPAVCEMDTHTPSHDASPKTASDALYSLLALRAITMSVHQGVDVLQLREVRYLCGDLAPAKPRRLEPDSYQYGLATLIRDALGLKPSPSAYPTSIPRPDPSLKKDATKTLTFDFTNTILSPTHHLESILGMDPWNTDFPTWVINTILAKLRAVASAHQVRDRDQETGVLRVRPAVAAVHPRWCLANHSCDPSVMWSWGGDIGDPEHRTSADANTLVGADAGSGMNGEDGSRRGNNMRFTVRPSRIWDQAAAAASAAQGQGELGKTSRGKTEGEVIIKAGTEILSHYCDVSLPARERREWAKGALGGDCRCERCLWEVSRENAAEPESS